MDLRVVLVTGGELVDVLVALGLEQTQSAERVAVQVVLELDVADGGVAGGVPDLQRAVETGS